MRRREFITLLGSAAIWSPATARAQQSERRVVVLIPTAEADPDGLYDSAAFGQSLAERGWKNGRDVLIDLRWAIDSADKAKAAIAELQTRPPDVVVAFTSQTVAALERALPTVPLVFAYIYDPVGQGFVQSLARIRAAMPPASQQWSPLSGRNGCSCSWRWRRVSPMSPICATPTIPVRYSPILPRRLPGETNALRSRWQTFTTRRALRPP